MNAATPSPGEIQSTEFWMAREVFATKAGKEPAAFTWDEGERKFHDRFGRTVSRKAVRESVDRYVDNLVAEVGDITERMVAGEVDVDQWQRQMASVIKRGHVTAMSIAKGGKDQVTQSDWGRTAQIVRTQYDYLYRFARQLEDGREVHGGTVARAKMYALAATGTYENQLRRDDIDAGYDVERRILHSANPCNSCVKYAGMGWRRAGELPGIGQQCKCLTRCRCTFERYRSDQSRAKQRRVGVKRTPREKPPGRTPETPPPEFVQPKPPPPATIAELKERLKGVTKMSDGWRITSDYIKELERGEKEPVMDSGMSNPEDLQSIQWNGTKWMYDRSEPGNPVVSSLYNLAKYPEDVSENLFRHTARVIFSKQRNKHDDYWATQYNMPGFKSLATAGRGTTVVYNGSYIDPRSMVHESAHNMATAKWGETKPPGWSDFGKAISANPSAPTKYGSNSTAEDFAESVAEYYESGPTFKASHPGRWEVVDRLMREADYGG